MQNTVNLGVSTHIDRAASSSFRIETLISKYAIVTGQLREHARRSPEDESEESVDRLLNIQASFEEDLLGLRLTSTSEIIQAIKFWEIAILENDPEQSDTFTAGLMKSIELCLKSLEPYG